MTKSWFLRQGALHAIFDNGFWKNDHDFLIAFYSNFLVTMHGFRDKEVLLLAGYDVIVISQLGAFQAIFHVGFWKSDHDFRIAYYRNFLVTMHGFRDNEVLFQTGYDVIVISQLGGVSGNFSWRILKERPWLPNGNFCPNSNGLEVIRHFLFAWDFPTGSKILVFCGEHDPQKVKRALLWVNPRLLNYCALKLVHGYRLQAVGCRL